MNYIYIDEYSEKTRENIKKYTHLQDNQNFFSNETINLHKRIEDGVLELKGDLSMLDEYNITFSMLLKLIRYYPTPKQTNIFTTEITGTPDGKVWIYLTSREFKHLRVSLDFATMNIDNHLCYINPYYKNTQGIVLKGFREQVALARQLGFKHIYCVAGNNEKENKKNIKNIGCAYRPMLWFFHDEDLELSRNFQNVVKKSDEKNIRNCRTLNELLHLKDTSGKRIGLEYRQQPQNRKHFDAVFDLNSNSKSMQILKEYIKEKQQKNPQKYKGIEIE